jgi:hypothetical protein
MLFYYTLFLFIAFGSKLMLALAMIYMLLPSERSCNSCDEDTLLIRPDRSGQIFSRLTFGRVQRRWCPRCGWDGLARRVKAPLDPKRTQRPLRSPFTTDT